jgi:hypothetical protein
MREVLLGALRSELLFIAEYLRKPGRMSRSHAVCATQVIREYTPQTRKPLRRKWRRL